MRRNDQPPDPLVARRLEQVWTSPPAPGGHGSEFGNAHFSDAHFGGAGIGGAVEGGIGAASSPNGGQRPDWSADPLATPLDRAAPVSLGPHIGERALAALSPHRRAVKALAVVAAFVVVISAFLAWRARPSTITVAPGATTAATAGAMGRPPINASATALPSASATSAATMLVIAVEGKVRHPGLVRLPPGSRVADAIDAAGGAMPGTDLSFVNLAQKVVDGELIVVGVTPPPGVAATSGTGSSGAGGSSGTAQPGAPINLNTATEADLDTLPGIGPALAQRIIDYRTQHGAFRSVDELRNVSGIGDAKFAEIKDLVTV